MPDEDLSRSIRTISVDLPGRAYSVFFDRRERLPDHLQEAGLQPGPVLVVTDETVDELYGNDVRALLTANGWHPRSVVVTPGEATKSLGPLAQVYDAALGASDAERITRNTPVLALGGGVVGDLAGLAAATLLRGLPFVQVPTTVIAQVDSAVGGKTSINHTAGKNLIGAFHQPRLVLADVRVLRTLPAREYASGLAEAVKHALIADADFAQCLRAEWLPVTLRHPEVLSRLLARAVGIKADVVTEDEREHGRRALLNFGHTFGHALERVLGYGALTHGEAVTLGMRAALHLSASLRAGRTLSSQICLTGDLAEADALVRRLPAPPLPDTASNEALRAAMQADKKRTAEALRFVVLERLGRAVMVNGVASEAVDAAWNYVRRVSAGGSSSPNGSLSDFETVSA